jgi:hypothetical protein
VEYAVAGAVDPSGGEELAQPASIADDNIRLAAITRFVFMISPNDLSRATMRNNTNFLRWRT